MLYNMDIMLVSFIALVKIISLKLFQEWKVLEFG
jgi:hypothetical protein